MLKDKNESVKKTVGIVGGMGPGATALLFQKIIDYTDAQIDAEHIHILIDNRPSIPDRTAAILSGDDTPAKRICESGKQLEDMGAELIAIPCNTSHYFYSYIQEHLKVPVINMLEETAKECKKQGFVSVGVLATTGTKNSGIYEHALNEQGLQVVYPDEPGQEVLMSIIYEYVKAGKKVSGQMFKSHIENMKAKGAQAFILGCTELPMVFSDGDMGVRFIDSLDILAKSTVKMAGYPLKQS